MNWVLTKIQSVPSLMEGSHTMKNAFAHESNRIHLKSEVFQKRKLAVEGPRFA